MKLNSGFISHYDGENKLLVSTGATSFSGLVRSNPTASFIIECLENETNEDEIVAKMQAKWDVTDDRKTGRPQNRRAAQGHRGDRWINLHLRNSLPKTAS